MGACRGQNTPRPHLLELLSAQVDGLGRIFELQTVSSAAAEDLKGAVGLVDWEQRLLFKLIHGKKS